MSNVFPSIEPLLTLGRLVCYHSCGKFFLPIVLPQVDIKIASGSKAIDLLNRTD